MKLYCGSQLNFTLVMLGETLVELCQSKQASYRNSEYRLLEKLPDRQADRLYKKLSTVKLGNKELFGLVLAFPGLAKVPYLKVDLWYGIRPFK